MMLGAQEGENLGIDCGQISLQRILLTNGKKILNSEQIAWGAKQNIIKWKSLQDALSKWPSRLYWQSAGKLLVAALQVLAAFASTVRLYSYPIEL